MSLATKAAACTSCGKRLNRKRWYYRNGQYFCKKSCWVSAHEKAAKDAAAAGPHVSVTQEPPAPPASPTQPPAA